MMANFAICKISNSLSPFFLKNTCFRINYFSIWLILFFHNPYLQSEKYVKLSFRIDFFFCQHKENTPFLKEIYWKYLAKFVKKFCHPLCISEDIVLTNTKNTIIPLKTTSPTVVKNVEKLSRKRIYLPSTKG